MPWAQAGGHPLQQLLAEGKAGQTDLGRNNRGCSGGCMEEGYVEEGYVEEGCMEEVEQCPRGGRTTKEREALDEDDAS